MTKFICGSLTAKKINYAMISVFSRRHPYLFFILSFTIIVSVLTLGVSSLVALGKKSTNLEFGEKVGVVEIKGVISEAQHITRALKRLRNDDSIKAIVVRIDSPGGAVGPAQEIFSEILKTRKTKKVVASFGSIAASGGYYVAAAADGIIANPGTITGSIGVIMTFTNLQTLFEKIGMTPTVIKSGKYKDVGSPNRKMTADEQQMLQKLVDGIRAQFVNAIATGRNIAPAKVEPLADGRIFSGQEAKELGLIDKLGNFEDAIEWAGRLGGIKGKIETEYTTKDKYPFIRYLLESSFNTLVNRLLGP
jgi:protease IV